MILTLQADEHDQIRLPLAGGEGRLTGIQHPAYLIDNGLQARNIQRDQPSVRRPLRRFRSNSGLRLRGLRHATRARPGRSIEGS